MKRFLIALGLLLSLASPALAQSCPAPTFYYGWVPTAAQWNQEFSCKQNALGYVPVNKAGDTMGGELVLSTTGIHAPLNFPLAVADPSAVATGDMWMTAAGLNFRVPGQTISQMNTPTYTGGSAPAFPTLYSFWNNTAGATIPYSIYDGAQWVNIGTLNPSTHVWTAASGGSVTSFSAGSTGFTPSSATTGIVTLAGTLNVGHGGTGLTAGTSGGIPYFSSTSAMSSSALLAANQLVLGGGAGTAPATLGSLGTTTTVLHGNAAGAPTFGAISLTADVSGILPGANGGSGVANTGTTFTRSANLITTGAGATTLAFGASTQTYTFPTTTATLARTDTGQTFTGTNIFGVLTATSFNGNFWTAGTGTLAIGAGKTHTVNNSIALTGTDGTTMTFPTTSATIARTDAGQTFTGTQAFGAITYSTLNGNTWASGTGTLSIAAGKTFTASNTLTVSGTDGSSLAIGTGGTLAATAYSTSAANLSGTASVNLFNGGTGASASTFLAGDGTWKNPSSVITSTLYTSGTGATLTSSYQALGSLSVPAGKWLFSGGAASGTTAVNYVGCAISTTTDSSAGAVLGSTLMYNAIQTINGVGSITMPQTKITVGSTTTYFFNCVGASTTTGWGWSFTVTPVN